MPPEVLQHYMSTLRYAPSTWL